MYYISGIDKILFSPNHSMLNIEYQLLLSTRGVTTFGELYFWDSKEDGSLIEMIKADTFNDSDIFL